MSLQAKQLTVGYPGHPVIEDINCEVLPGKLTVLIGANGCGKSTLLRTLSGSQPPLQGEVTYNGISLEQLSPSRIARFISIVLTERQGGGGLRVDELVALGRHPYSGFFGKLTNADQVAVKNALASVGLTHKSHEYIAKLSDGERQKAMIARAIAQQTAVIILDEPSSFLDVSSRFEIMEVLSRIAHDDGRAVILSTHDTGASLTVADFVWAVIEGRLYEGKLEDLVNQGIMDKVFPNSFFDKDRKDFNSSFAISR